MNFDEIIQIIKSSELEDVVILNENYERMLHDLPDGDEKNRYVVLNTESTKRIKELKEEQSA